MAQNRKEEPQRASPGKGERPNGVDLEHLMEQADFAPVSREWHWITDTEHRFCYFSDSFRFLTGISPERFLGSTRFDRIDVCDPETLRSHLADLRARRRFEYFVYGSKSAGGALRWYRVNGQPIWGEAEQFLGYCGTATDITPIKESEALAQKNQKRFAEVQRIANIGVWELDWVTGDLWWSGQTYRIFGLDPGRPIRDTSVFYQLVHPDDRETVRETTLEAVNGGTTYQIVHRIVLPSGETRLVQENAECLYDPAGRPLTLHGTIQDVTDRERAADALQESEALFRTFIDQMPAAVSLKETDGSYITVNRTFREWFGPPEGPIGDYTVRDLVSAEHAAEILQMEQKVREELRPLTQELEVPQLRGAPRKAYIHKFPLFDGEGSFWAIGTIETDCTDLRDAEAQLHQSQKMETIGQLTGGVAHDFNNLLGIIQGHIEIALEHSGGTCAAPHLDVAIRATERGAELTRRLLAFSRKQSLTPVAVDLRELLDDMAGLLDKAVGPRIKIATETDDSLWKALVDPNQLENAILNLVLNARDAMDGQGEIHIKVSNIRMVAGQAAEADGLDRGDYLRIAVADNGTGMTKEECERACEPFFTTKPFGSGSGLGLSTTHGFISQSGGCLQIASTPGEGATVTLYLPRTSQESQSRVRVRGESIVPRGQRQNILVIDDNEDLLAMLSGMLGSLGYNVLEARSGECALATLEEGTPLHAVLTDVVLSDGFSGHLLAAKAREKVPDLPIVFMSGYDQGSMTENAGLGDEAGFLHKPFRKADLAKAIHHAMSR